ncbi:MAG: (Fe-S)-binding protein [Desulfobacterales bacterium]
MADVKELVKLMRDLEDQLVVCMRCGMCQSVCPVFEQTGLESDVARGKLALLDGLMKDMFDDAEGLQSRLTKCLLCGSCTANCPSGVSATEIFMKARAILAGYIGLPPAKRLLLRGMLAHPGLFDRMTEWGARFQKLLTRPVNDVLGTSCARLASPLLGDRHFRSFASVPFHRRQAAMSTSAGNSGLRAGFFVGCLLDKLYPDLADAVIQVLSHHGVGIFLPGNMACCGIPAVSSGDTRTFEHLVRHNIDLLEGEPFDVLVTACATCTATIKEVWPKMIGEKDPSLKRRVDRLAAKTMDISQFMVSRVGLGPAAEPFEDAEPVTYHDPCHLKKSLGVSAEPRLLIRANPRYRLVEMRDADRCCGMGGSFNLQHYEISSNIGKLKRDNIVATGCGTVATSCPACMHQISDALSKAGDRIQVKHPVEIYAEAIRRHDTAKTD